jgi:hypothetical protein
MDANREELALGARGKQPVEVKKVKPYPIAAKVFKADTPAPIEGQILRVTQLGFQMEVTQLAFSVGNTYKAEFSLPLSQHVISENVKIVRTMDRFIDGKATVKGYLVEMHFLNISPMTAKAIKEFEIAINQKSSGM